MSFRFLYRRIPVTERICSYYRCQRPILRNIDRDKDGNLYHHGCLMSAKDEQYKCLECYRQFDATEASFDSKQIIRGDDMREASRVICPSCGSHNIKPLGAFD